MIELQDIIKNRIIIARKFYITDIYYFNVTLVRKKRESFSFSILGR